LCIEEKPINKKKKTPSGSVPMIGTGGSCCYDIRANNDFFLSFPNASKIKWRKERERERPVIIINNKRIRKSI
jgi:hypothetical protein